MTRFILIRLAGLIPVLLILSIITFALMHGVPGGPWTYGERPFTDEQLAEQNKRIIRLCRYPDMIPDELLVAYADVLLASLGHLRRAGRLREFVNDKLRDRVLDIAGRLNENDPETYRLALGIHDELRVRTGVGKVE